MYYNFSDEELDMMVAADESLNAPETRGKAYKRVQRRNHMYKRVKDAMDLHWYSKKTLTKKEIGHMAKNHMGCKNARCIICHYGKIFNYPTIQEMKANDRMKYDMKDYYNV